MTTTDFTTAPPATQQDPQKRVNYSLGLVLGVDEFEQEQFYHLERGRQHNRALHGYGTVCGLQLTTSGSQVYVSPGLAIDPRGRVIEVERVQCADLNQWLSVQTNLQSLGHGASSPLGPASLYVVLCYRECLTDKVPVPGAPCRTEEDTLAPSRITESFDLRFTTTLPDAHEELAIRRFGDLLRQIEVSTTGNPSDFLTVERMEQFVRALESTASPLGSPLNDAALLLHPQDAEAVLRAGFRVWITEVRPSLLATGCGVPVEGCVLLGRLDFNLTSAGHVAPQAAPVITADDSDRPYLLPTRLLQENIFRGLIEAVVAASSPPSAPPPVATNLAGDVSGPIAANVVRQIQSVPVANTPPADGQVLTFVGASGRWQPSALPAPTPPTLQGDAAGPVGATNVQRIRGISVDPSIPPSGSLLTAVPAVTPSGVQWQAVTPSFVVHPAGGPSYGIVAAGNLQVGAAAAPATSYQGLAAVPMPGAAANSGRVLLTFPAFKPGAAQYIVKAMPSFEQALEATFQSVPIILFAGVSAATNPPGLLLQLVDARTGQALNDAIVKVMRLMVEISEFPFTG